MNIEKIEAKYFSENDIETRVEWINNPKINSSMFFDIPASIVNTKKWHQNNIGNNRRVDFSFYRINNELIGMGGLTSIDLKNGHTEFYIMINPKMHGKGFGKRISKWIFNYAFLKYKLNKIYLYTNDDNISAYKIYEDSGFKLEGILRNHKVKNGKLLNRRFYGLLKEEWSLEKWTKDEINNTFL